MVRGGGGGFNAVVPRPARRGAPGTVRSWVVTVNDGTTLGAQALKGGAFLPPALSHRRRIGAQLAGLDAGSHVGIVAAQPGEGVGAATCATGDVCLHTSILYWCVLIGPARP